MLLILPIRRWICLPRILGCSLPAAAQMSLPAGQRCQPQGAFPAPEQIGPVVQIFSSSLGAMVSLLAKLRSLLVSAEDHLPEPLKSQKDKLEIIRQDLEAINTFLVNLSWVEAPNMMVKHWMNEVRDLSYDIEDYIDNCREEPCSDSEVEELSTLVKQAKDAHERHNRYDLGRWASNPRFVVDGGEQGLVPRLNGDATDLVGISDSKAELIKRLNIDAEQRLVLSIQGPPGVGKTTLAKQVYCEIEGRFECGAFVRASKMPDTRRLLSSIISQIQPRDERPPHGLPVQELIDSLRKHLQQKRYLIVIDGLWETTSWDIVSSAFPDDTHCSRILITTNIEEVALECCDYESDAIFKMETLGGNHSTELFFNRVFGFKHECSKQLKECSEEIIRTCGGLPLAIISIASILAIQPDNLELWRHVKEALFSRLRYNLTSEVKLREIVSLSYNSLPCHLKTCLLYLSMYPEGYTFFKADLVKQWSAEGFIIPGEEKNCDEVAECYFDELTCRGLIQPNHTNISDEVTLYTLHSTVFEVIRSMSIEENFSTVIDYSNTISELSVKIRRLSLRFSSAKYATKPETIKLSPVRSLMFYGLVECLPSIMEFEVLRVLILDVWGDHDQELDLSGIGRLFQLRYMRITSNIIVKLPARVIGLQFLQTMEIYAKVTSVPSDIIHLPRLVHLCVRGEINLSKDIGHMGSLRTFQSFDLSSNSEDNIRQLGEMTDLRDLHVISPTEVSDPLKGKLIAFVSSLEKLGNLKSIIFELAPATSCTSIDLDCSWSISSLSVFLQRLELLPPICIFSRLPVWIGQLRKLCILKIVLRELTTGDVDSIAKLQELTILSLWHKKSELDEVAAVVEEVSPSAQHQEAPAPPVSRFPQAQPQPLAQQPLVPSPLGLSRYESQKWRDWNTFLQYLQNHRPPLKLACCTGAHVIEFLRYLDQFGKTRVHLEGCDYFGQPNPPVPCACPLRQAWGSLDALIGRLRAGYEEFGGRPESNPFMAKDVRIYLRDVREAQAKASGISYVKKKPKHGSTAASPVAPPPVVTAETAGTMSGAAGEVDDDDEPSSSVGELRQRQRKVATSAGGIPAPAAAARAAQQPPTHAELERVRCVGSGAGGTVWMVRHRGTGQLYALKVLKGNHNYDVRRQIAREIAILRTADHPAVVRCHGMYEHGGELQILLEYMDGGSLNGHHIATEPLLADVARQVLSGIAYLHRRHIVHCGIKPSNLLIDSARHVKIAEFGVGHILKQTMEPSNSSVGTIAYMSPEQINTNLSDGSYAGDVWSFGLSILELYLGRFPFGENENLSKQGDLANLMCAICFSYPPEPPRTASPEFRGFISCCLKKNPAKRLTAAQLLQHPFVASTQPQPQLLAAPPLP